ncbi:BlaI/MecI/CopY family transcriptional regulator [Pseudoalteromonas elyakovii]|uniref:BlaI/MecI/CopY family transcriptional regulator n=1 Tax=uncultured Pseudoalteromonas sp. TaxID=114053 RepID=UPI002364139F|nr:BlaI/MecI/CopY family transcriptional regulator [uncultured Pseudoalteromonas sp.]MDC3190073.1 BlaI/MecI/CopY family transcriptional regulator [Pseudoalteromonas elyakovii]
MQLGELEKLVLQYLWNAKEADAKQVHSVLGERRGNSLNTIQSTLERLFKKELLTRTKQGHAYVYRAKVDREGLIAQLITNVTSDFVEQGEHSLIAAFSSASAHLNDAQLDKLEQLIEQQRQMRKGR